MAAAFELSPKQLLALEAICDTFCPPQNGNGVAGVHELGVADAIAGAVALNPREAERKQLAQLLSLWDTHLLTALGGGGRRRFGTSATDEREQVLLSWCDSGVPAARGLPGAAQGRPALLLDARARMAPAARSGTRSTTPGPWARGRTRRPRRYARPDGPRHHSRVRRLHRRLRSRRRNGGRRARGGRPRRRRARGGGLLRRRGLRRRRADGLGRMYHVRRRRRDPRPGVGLLAGSCLGGGTTVNYTTSFRTPDDVREEWASHGCPRSPRRSTPLSLDAVCDRLGVNQEHNALRARGPDPATRPARARLARGPHAAQRARLRAGRELRLLQLRLPLGAKHSTVKTWLADATRPAPASSSAPAPTGFVRERGRSRRRGAHRRRAPRHRPLARRGRRLRSHPHARAAAALRASRTRTSASTCGCTRRTAVWEPFDEKLDPWEGTMQALYSDEHRDLMDDGYGVKYETAAIHPQPAGGLLALARRARHTPELMEALPTRRRSASCCVTATAARCGSIATGTPSSATRSPTTTSATSGTASGRRADPRGGRRAADLLLPLRGSHTTRARRRSEHFMRDADACGWDAGPLHVRLFHIMGIARMGGSPEHLRLQSARADLGGTRPLRLRRLRVPDRLGGEPDDLDRVHRAHERVGARCPADVTNRVRRRAPEVTRDLRGEAAAAPRAARAGFRTPIPRRRTNSTPRAS